MEKELFKSYQKGLSVIEDLQMLTNYEVTPLIHNIYHYFSEMNKAAQYLTEDKNRFFNIKARLEENFNSAIRNFLLEQKNIKQVNFYNNLKEGSLDNWDRFTEVFPLCLSIIKILPFTSFMEFELNPDIIKVRGEISEDLKPKKLRKDIYFNTRKLFKKKAIMTFKVLESDTMNNTVELSIDISHKKDSFVCVCFEESGLILGLSNTFNHYRINIPSFFKLPNHPVVEIKSDLTVKSWNSQDLNKKELTNKKITHFRFLFRPLSIIVPKVKQDFFTRNIHEIKNINGKFHYMDFFSLAGD